MNLIPISHLQHGVCFQFTPNSDVCVVNDRYIVTNGRSGYKVKYFKNNKLKTASYKSVDAANKRMVILREDISGSAKQIDRRHIQTVSFIDFNNKVTNSTVNRTVQAILIAVENPVTGQYINRCDRMGLSYNYFDYEQDVLRDYKESPLVLTHIKECCKPQYLYIIDEIEPIRNNDWMYNIKSRVISECCGVPEIPSDKWKIHGWVKIIATNNPWMLMKENTFQVSNEFITSYTNAVNTEKPFTITMDMEPCCEIQCDGGCEIYGHWKSRLEDGCIILNITQIETNPSVLALERAYDKMGKEGFDKIIQQKEGWPHLPEFTEQMIPVSKVKKLYDGVVRNVGTCVKREDMPTFEQWLDDYNKKNEIIESVKDCPANIDNMEQLANEYVASEGLDMYRENKGLVKSVYEAIKRAYKSGLSKGLQEVWNDQLIAQYMGDAREFWNLHPHDRYYAASEWFKKRKQ